MKSLQTCPTKASTPFKDSKEIISMSSLSSSNKRKKSLTVYSAIKNANQENKEFQQIKRPKSHLKLVHSSNKTIEKSDNKMLSRQQETGGVMIKMSLCGPKICDVSIQNPYKIFDEPLTQKQLPQKRSRVLYQSKKLASELSESQSINSIEFKLINLPKIQQRKNKYCEISLDQKSYVLEQQAIFEKGEQKQEHTKNDSFSIRNFSSYINPFQSSLQNSFIEREQNNVQNLDKLRQIYRNSLKSQFSYQYNQPTNFYFENSQLQNFSKQENQRLAIDIKKLNQKTKNQKEQSILDISSNFDHNVPDSTRTIIQILNDWDLKN